MARIFAIAANHYVSLERDTRYEILFTVVCIWLRVCEAKLLLNMIIIIEKKKNSCCNAMSTHSFSHCSTADPNRKFKATLGPKANADGDDDKHSLPLKEAPS